MAVLRIGKRLDQCEKFKNRTRPAVNQQQRYCAGTRRALMDKINLLSINFRGELIKAVDLRFLRAPVAGELLFLPRFLRIPRPATILRCAIWPFFSSISLPSWLGCSVLAASVPSLRRELDQ
jgi:hypothetical protein